MMEEEVINVEDESSDDDDDDLVQEVVNLNNQTSNSQAMDSTTDSASEGDQWDQEERSGHEYSNKNRRRRRRENTYSKEYYQRHRAEILQKRAQRHNNRKSKDDHDEIPKVREMVTVHRVKDTPMIQSVESLAGEDHEADECQVVSVEEDKDKVEPDNGLVIAVSWSRGKSAQCPHCPYNAGASAVAEHVKTVHLKIKDFSCHLCDFSSSAERLLKYHLRQKHNHCAVKENKKDGNKLEKPRFPPQTVVKQTGRSDLKFDYHTSKECPKCPYITKSGNLARHMRSAHMLGNHDSKKGDQIKSNDFKFCGKEKSAGNGNQTVARDTTENFNCNLCPFASGEKDDLITHVNRAHRSSSLDEEPEPPQALRSEVTNVGDENGKDLGDNTRDKQENDGGRQPKPQVPSQTPNSSADVRIYKVQNPPPSPPPPPPSTKATETMLPGGWVKKIVPRTSGAYSGRSDAYLYAPDGTKLRQVLTCGS